jgi:hypothetical protein
MQRHRTLSLGIAALALGLGLASCNWKIKPTYKANQIASDLKKMCVHDYGMNVETRVVGNTLQAFFWRVGLLKPGELEMRMDAAEALERVLLCATRISLSTDAPLQFLEVKMADALTGATVTLWRFVPDIRDSMYTRMPEEEYINRLVVEFDTDSDLRPKEWKEIKWDPSMSMAEFIAKQVVLRVKRQSPIGLQVHEDLSKPKTLVVVLDNWSAIEKQGSKQEKKVTDLVESTAKTVIQGYQFTGFHDFVVEDQRGAELRSLTF